MAVVDMRNEGLHDPMEKGCLPDGRRFPAFRCSGVQWPGQCPCSPGFGTALGYRRVAHHRERSSAGLPRFKSRLSLWRRCAASRASISARQIPVQHEHSRSSSELVPTIGHERQTPGSILSDPWEPHPQRTSSRIYTRDAHRHDVGVVVLLVAHRTRVVSQQPQ